MIISGNKGVGASLKAVQVTKFVQYSPSENLDEFEESGYQAQRTAHQIKMNYKTISFILMHLVRKT